MFGSDDKKDSENFFGVQDGAYPPENSMKVSPDFRFDTFKGFDDVNLDTNSDGRGRVGGGSTNQNVRTLGNTGPDHHSLDNGYQEKFKQIEKKYNDELFGNII